MLLSDVCLTSVVYIGPNSRTERPRKTEIGTELANITRDLDTTFKVKGHQAALLGAALTREAGAAVTMRTYWAWETTDTLRLLGGVQGIGAPTGRRGAGAYRVTMLTACLLYICFLGSTPER